MDNEVEKRAVEPKETNVVSNPDKNIYWFWLSGWNVSTGVYLHTPWLSFLMITQKISKNYGFMLIQIHNSWGYRYRFLSYTVVNHWGKTLAFRLPLLWGKTCWVTWVSLPKGCVAHSYHTTFPWSWRHDSNQFARTTNSLPISRVQCAFWFDCLPYGFCPQTAVPTNHPMKTIMDRETHQLIAAVVVFAFVLHNHGVKNCQTCKHQ